MDVMFKGRKAKPSAIEHLLGLCNYVAPSVAGSDDIQ